MGEPLLTLLNLITKHIATLDMIFWITRLRGLRGAIQATKAPLICIDLSCH